MHFQKLYSHHEHGPAWAQPANPKTQARMTIPPHATSCVRLLFATMKEFGIPYDTVAEASGNRRRTLKAWRFRSSPTYATIEAAFNAIGWHFLPCPKIEALPDDIAADLGRLASKMKSGLPEVWSALADLASDQAFLRERAKGRIEAREAERAELGHKRARRHRKPKTPANDNRRQVEIAA